MRLSRLFKRDDELKPDKDGIKRWLWPSFERSYRKDRERARRRRQLEHGILRLAR